MIELLAALGICLAVVWQGNKTRQSADIAFLSIKAIGTRAAEAAENAHNIVNSQRSEMLRLIAQLREELAKAHGQPRPSNAVLGLEMPTPLEPIVETPDVRVKRLIGLLQDELGELIAKPGFKPVPHEDDRTA